MNSDNHCISCIGTIDNCVKCEASAKSGSLTCTECIEGLDAGAWDAPAKNYYLDSGKCAACS